MLPPGFAALIFTATTRDRYTVYAIAYTYKRRRSATYPHYRINRVYAR